MGCFGGGGKTEYRTVVQSDKLPEFVQKGAEENYNTAKELSQRPYQPYTGPRLAGFNEDQTGAIDMVRNNAGVWKPSFENAKSITTDIANTRFPDADLSAYMNPFDQLVTDQVIKDIRKQGARGSNQIKMNMASGNAFGGDRHGVVEGMHDQGVNDAISRAIAEGRSRSFLNAEQAFQNDQARGMDAARQLSSLSAAEQGLGTQDAAALMDMGKLQQLFGQANLDLSYEDFMRQRDYPIEMLNMRINALDRSPYGTESSSVQPYQTSNNFAQNLGAFGALAGGASMLADAGGIKALFS